MLRPIRTDANNVAVSWPPIPRRRFGVPIGGPFDAYAFRTALALLGEEQGEGLEIGFFGGEWEAEEDIVVAHVGPARENSVNGNNLFALSRGDQISLGIPKEGHRSYLVAKPGTIDQPIRLADMSLDRSPIRLIESSELKFSDREHTVTPNINRIGLRLAPVAEFAHEIELPSEPQCVGAIQITRDGTPIVIGPDGPTIGGYPKAGVVISADLGRLAQLKPGDHVIFNSVLLDQAREAAKVRETEWRKLLSELRLALRLGGLGPN